MSPIDIDALADAVVERLEDRLALVRPVMSVAKVAELFDVSERTVREMIARGRLPSLKIEGARRVDAGAVRDYLAEAERREGTATAPDGLQSPPEAPDA